MLATTIAIIGIAFLSPISSLSSIRMKTLVISDPVDLAEFDNKQVIA
jgi:hypothetical protein